MIYGEQSPVSPLKKDNNDKKPNAEASGYFRMHIPRTPPDIHREMRPGECHDRKDADQTPGPGGVVGSNVESVEAERRLFCTLKIGCGGAVALGFGDILWFGVFF